jgi:hypothetical protein
LRQKANLNFSGTDFEKTFEVHTHRDCASGSIVHNDHRERTHMCTIRWCQSWARAHMALSLRCYKTKLFCQPQ